MFVPLTAQLPDSSNILTAILLHLLILRPLPLVRNGATFFPRRLFKLSICSSQPLSRFCTFTQYKYQAG